MAIKRFVLTDDNKKLTPEQLKEVEEACNRPSAYDPDFPPLTEEQLLLKTSVRFSGSNPATE